MKTTAFESEEVLVGRVFDGARWETISNYPGINVRNDRITSTKTTATEPHHHHTSKQTTNASKIFVSVINYRDGKRCGVTLKSIFDNAENPASIIVGLVEQNSETDIKCLDHYCHLHGFDITTTKSSGGDETTKQKSNSNKNSSLQQQLAKSQCPYYHNVRQISVFDIAASGPVAARALMRKILGDEEFCLQIDAHSELTSSWDKIALDEWHSIGNDFAVLSTLPASFNDQFSYESRKDGIYYGRVPRICTIDYNPASVPYFPFKPEDAIAENLEKPLLSLGWNAGFSFHKCHLEEAVPYDSYLKFAFDVEEFNRLARMWTRGYDVYTPTRNIVYHRYGDHPDGINGKQEWGSHPQSNDLRLASIKRMMVLLSMGVHADRENFDSSRANMGIYGLGKRRTMNQFEKFIGMNVRKSLEQDAPCGMLQYVPYELDKSPGAMDNMYEHADNLDSQPEFPKRSYSQQPLLAGDLKHHLLMEHLGGESSTTLNSNDIENAFFKGSLIDTNGLSVVMMFLLWSLGLLIWYFMFISSHPLKRHIVSEVDRALSSYNALGSKDVRIGSKTGENSHKDV